MKVLSVALLATQATAFPWVARQAGYDPADFKRTPTLIPRQAGSAATCPNNPTHTPAVPISAKYPYCGAKGGVPGYQVCTNNLVPAVVCIHPMSSKINLCC